MCAELSMHLFQDAEMKPKEFPQGPSAVRRRQWLPAAWNEPADANMTALRHLKAGVCSKT